MPGISLATYFNTISPVRVIWYVSVSMRGTQVKKKVLKVRYIKQFDLSIIVKEGSLSGGGSMDTRVELM